MGRIAEIVLEGATPGYDRKYSYSVSENFGDALAGCRAVVPFGRGDRKKQGMILSVRSGDADGLKGILSVVDSEPVLNAEMLSMCEYLHEHTFCTWFDAVHAMLPVGIGYKLTDYYSPNPEFMAESLLSNAERAVLDFIKSKGEVRSNSVQKSFPNSEELLKSLFEKEAVFRNYTPVRRVGDASQRWLSLKEGADTARLTERQREVVQVLNDAGSVSVKELKYFTGVTDSVIKTLVKNGVVTEFEKEVYRAPYRCVKPVLKSEIELTDEQNAAYVGMLNQIEQGKGSVALLHGVTGSGKTQVFLKLVDEVSQKGLGVIIMVPEIALTPQMINIFCGRYGNKIAVFHSAMSVGQRLDEWKRIKNGDALIAIGTRSAVFAPFNKLGLIIMDEEHEHTYKSEKSPRFHARELAKFRAYYNNTLLCLASATPSVESYTAALSGKYSLYKLTKRYGNAVLPDVETVDMRKEITSGNASSVSRVLYDGIEEALDNKKQVILLLNRRGHNTYITCPDCGYVATCPNCSISLTYHSANGRLMCHYCGYSQKADKKCPQCGGEHMRFMGIGTQKVAEDVEKLFPSARLLRVDADSTMTRESYSDYLKSFANGEYDIMLGTQMVAKGLDFPNVTLVGVLGADRAMYSEDFRSFERTFSLLTQVVGRAGRGSSPGRAVIQTVNPEENVIELAKTQDYEAFYEEEILTRKLMIYPPYCDICLVCVSSQSREDAEDAINSIFKRIKEIINNTPSIKVIILGPAPAAIPKVSNRYRYRMIIKCKNNSEFRKMLRNAIDIKRRNDVSIAVDVNPETVI